MNLTAAQQSEQQTIWEYRARSQRTLQPKDMREEEGVKAQRRGRTLENRSMASLEKRKEYVTLFHKKWGLL